MSAGAARTRTSPCGPTPRWPKVEGYVGNFKVKVRRKPRYINEDLCVGCSSASRPASSSEARFPDEFNLGLEQAQAGLHPLPAGHPAVVGHRPRDLHRVPDRQVQEDLRRGLAERNAIDFEQTGRDRGDRGRRDHPGHRLQDLRRRRASRSTATASTRTSTPPRGRAPGQRLRPHRRRGRCCATAASRRPSASSTASAAATRTPTATARASAACTR